MQEKSDLQLLRDYTECGQEAAFHEIVLRYTDFVYAAALRQAESADRAADIAQNVFVDLARKARSVAERSGAEASLAGWLHRATRYAALNHLRDNRRRVNNERQAMEQLLTDSEPAADWVQIRPVLDEALDSLGDDDREAVLLRYFQNQDFRAVGIALGISDDAAQKRVSRAVERLREFFLKRKIAIGAGGLVALISANVGQAAPAGLAAAISTAALAGTAVSTSTAIAATKIIAMTTLQKAVVTATVAVLAAAGIYEARQAAQLGEENQALRQQQAPLAEQVRHLQNNLADATNRLADMLAENSRLKSNPNQTELLKLRGEVTQLKTAAMQKKSDPIEAVATARAAKVNQLKQRLEQMPNERIPELQYLTAQDWLRGATYSGDLNTDDDLDRALSQLRRDAKRTFAYSIGEALANYIAGHRGQLPGDISQLESYFNPPIDGTILQRYQLLRAGNLSDIPNNEPLIAEKAPVDDQYDTLFNISATSFSYQGTGTSWVNGSGKGDFGTNITAKIKPFEREN
ncbi:MAG TPA: sigma-70 family RNA polymerase sigma factor [Candidatus Acidoferrum sp.]|nr:sigma-70 family RNA polymerase sigma factor [Candidatus Acidoferrum sp.]